MATTTPTIRREALCDGCHQPLSACWCDAARAEDQRPAGSCPLCAGRLVEEHDGARLRCLDCGAYA